MKRGLAILLTIFIACATKNVARNTKTINSHKQITKSRALKKESGNKQNIKKIKAHGLEKKKKQAPKERKLFTVVNPKKAPSSHALKNKEQNKIANKLRQKKELKNMTSFTVPKGFRPSRSLAGKKARKTENTDDPTAGEEKIESIPLLLFGDYEIIIEKK